METNKILQKLSFPTDAYDGSESETDRAILQGIEEAYQGMDDDFNTAMAIASLNEIGSYVHKLANKQIDASEVSPWVLERLKSAFKTFINDIFGLYDDGGAEDDGTLEKLMGLILDIRADVRARKEWAVSDQIREALTAAGITVKDGKEGATWSKT